MQQKLDTPALLRVCIHSFSQENVGLTCFFSRCGGGSHRHRSRRRLEHKCLPIGSTADPVQWRGHILPAHPLLG